MIYLVIMFPLFCLIVGIIYICYEFITRIRPQNIIDVDVNCLNGEISTIINVTQKYEKKVRGSVRMGQGRIKSFTEEEAKLKEKEIYFP